MGHCDSLPSRHGGSSMLIKRARGWEAIREVAREVHLYGGTTEELLGGARPAGVRLLGKRQSEGAPPPLEPSRRACPRHERDAADRSLQRLRGIRRRDVQG